MSGLHERLRHETRHAHLRLETDLAIKGRLGERSDVTLVLARFYGFFGPLEAGVAGMLGASSLDGRRRLAELSADLQALGLTQAELDRLPVCDEAGRFADQGEALGALYVTEGARLGGRVIARVLREVDWVPAQGLQFWSDDPRTGGLWRSYLERLEAPQTAPLATSVVSGACATFARLHRWLARGGVF